MVSDNVTGAAPEILAAIAATNEDECGAPEFFTNAAKLIVLNGEGGRIDAANIDRIPAYRGGDV